MKCEDGLTRSKGSELLTCAMTATFTRVLRHRNITVNIYVMCHV